MLIVETLEGRESIAGKADEAGGKEGESRMIYNGEHQVSLLEQET
jgi:hypothetical protein